MARFDVSFWQQIIDKYGIRNKPARRLLRMVAPTYQPRVAITNQTHIVERDDGWFDMEDGSLITDAVVRIESMSPLKGESHKHGTIYKGKIRYQEEEFPFTCTSSDLVNYYSEVVDGVLTSYGVGPARFSTKWADKFAYLAREFHKPVLASEQVE
jgi:hypothetical protein